jgi:ABC-2 type transport system permease protein
MRRDDAVRAARITRGLWHLCRSELVLFLREPAAMFCTMVLPQALLLFVGVVYGGEVANGVRFIDEYVPSVIAVTAANVGLLGVAFNIADARVRGVLRRYRLIPLPFWCYFASQAVVCVVMFVVATGALFLTTGLLYGIRFAGSLLAFAGVLGLSLLAMFLAGLALGGLNTTTRTTQLAATALFFVLFFGSGAAIPRSQFPDWLREITAFNPLTPVLDSLTTVYLGRDLADRVPQLLGLLSLAVVLAIVVRRTFRWEVTR